MPKRITIENAELTLTLAGKAYAFNWVNSVVINDPRENILSNSPQNNGKGIVYRQNLTTPVATEMVVREVPAELFDVLKEAFEDQNRVDFLLYDKVVGDQYTLDESVIRSNPSNLSLGESDSSFDVSLNISTSTSRFKHKPSVDGE